LPATPPSTSRIEDQISIMGQRHAVDNRRSVSRSELRPGALVRLRDPEGRLCEGVIHHLNASSEPFILPCAAAHEPFYAHPADIEEILGFHGDPMSEHMEPGRDSHRRRRVFGRRNKPR
jgi:hypothetical protein